MSLVGLGNQTSTTWTANVPHKEERSRCFGTMCKDVPWCAMMCHALQSQVPPVCRSGYLLVVFGEVSEKSQNLRWCRPWHGLDTALMSCELVLKRWNKKNPRITSIVPGFGAHTCRLVTEKRSESVWIFDDFCTASIALNHWTFGLLWTTFGLPFWIFLCSFCEAKWRELGTPWDTQRHWRRLPVLAHWKATWPKRSFRSRPLPITWYILIPFLRLFPKC